MEKIIKLAMNEDKSISILLNGVLKCSIAEGLREISAQVIYEIIDYKSGDSLSVISENEKEIDKNVLLYFKELFDDICERINGIDVDEDDVILKEE